MRYCLVNGQGDGLRGLHFSHDASRFLFSRALPAPGGVAAKLVNCCQSCDYFRVSDVLK